MATPIMTPDEIRQKIEQLSVDIGLLRRFVQGDETEMVPLGNVPTNSLRRFMALATDGVNGPIELAREWAENPEDVPVKDGSFSALHWAAKAMSGATGIDDIPEATPLMKGLVPSGGLPGQVYGVSDDGGSYGFQDASGSGQPLLSLIWSTTGLPEEGFLDVSKDNGLLPRAAFPDAWAKIQRAQAAGLSSVASDSAWLAETAASGVCGKFSTGDGSTTFRVPLLRKRVSFAADDTLGVGSFEADQMRPITGDIMMSGANSFGYTYSNASRTGAMTAGPRISDQSPSMQGVAGRSLGFDSSLLGSRYAGDITHGPIVVYTPLLKMYGTVDNPAVLNAAAAVQQIAAKLDTSAYEADESMRVKAWATCSPTGAIKKAYNIASVSKVSTGTYEVTMLSGAPDTKYVILGAAMGIPATNGWLQLVSESYYTKTTNVFRYAAIVNGGSSQVAVDLDTSIAVLW